MSTYYRTYLEESVAIFTLNPDFAYSFRKVISTATLSCRVRRSSDNAEQNIGFVGNDLDTASLLSFVGANNGFITTIYEQKGTGKNLTQISAINQFQIVASGVINTLNGKPTCVTTASKWMLTPYNLYPFALTDSNSIFSVTQPISQVGGGFNIDFLFSVGTGGLGTDRLFDNFTGGSAGNPTSYAMAIQPNASVISTAYSSGTKLQSSLFKNNEQKYYLNNSLIGTNTNSLTAISNTVSLVVNNTSWSIGTTASANMYFSEIIIYKSYQNTAITDINTNINNYYSIY